MDRLITKIKEFDDKYKYEILESIMITYLILISYAVYNVKV